MKTTVIGAGAAGMMCAILAAEAGLSVTLIEQNERLGKKLYITGKGRCNFTNVCEPSEFLENVLSNPRFLYSSIYSLTPKDTVSLFESWGLRTKTERGRRAFPSSDRSADVIDMFRDRLKRCKVRVLLNTKAEEILTDNGCIRGVSVTENGVPRTIESDLCVIATGGISYPSTGATGDGYRFAKSSGHALTELSPSLVPISCLEEYVIEMQGLSLKNVGFHIKSGRKEVYSGFGELMFTHFGITGPLVLSASAKAGAYVGKEGTTAWIDLKPALTEEMLDARLLRIFEENPNRDLKNILPELYPSKLQTGVLKASGLDPDLKVHDLTKEARRKLIAVTKHFPVTLTALRGFNEAVVTKGGVSVRDINPSTMESRFVSGLYFIGEVLDVDAYTGGYNLQIAWSTAACAAAAMAEKKEA